MIDIIATDGGGDFGPADWITPEDTKECGWEPTQVVRVNGVCVALADEGVVVGYKGQEQHKLALRFDVKLPTGNTKYIWAEYTLSLNDNSNLRKVLRSWRGKDFTPEEAKAFKVNNLLGKQVEVSLYINDKGYAKVSDLAPARDEKVEPLEEPFVYSYLDPAQENYDKLSPMIKNNMSNRPGETAQAE